MTMDIMIKPRLLNLDWTEPASPIELTGNQIEN